MAFVFPVSELFLRLVRETWNGKVETSAIGEIVSSPGLLMSIGAFIVAVVGIHLVIAFMLWALWMPFIDSRKLAEKQRLGATLLFYLVVQMGFMALNMVLFPSSRFFAVALPYGFITTGATLLMALLVWHISRLICLLRHARKVARWKCLASAIVLLFVGGSFAQSDGKAADSVSGLRKNPDIILIGIDCLRPDHILAGTDTITPNLDAFLTQSVFFERAYTPLARTFPSWMSVLTGRYPINHGARFNLSNPGKIIRPGENLPFLLKKNGYMTAYAIDEARFSNIDESYGFDIALTPRIGAADFLLTKFADSPIINLMSMTSAYKWLFPNQYRNRAAKFVYDPEVFNHGLERMIGQVDSAKPLLLATHFELPHWPFDWKNSVNYSAPYNSDLARKSPIAYQKALHRVDRQFQSLIEALKRHGRLKNAIVVVLSDHGEGFEDFAPEWTSAVLSRSNFLPPFSWHGTNVLDESQTRVVLGFRVFGRDDIGAPSKIGKTASLIDIAPTVLDLANISYEKLGADGCPLFAQKNGISACSPDRVVLTESGFYVTAMMKKGPLDEVAVARQAQGYYAVTASGRLMLRGDVYEKLLHVKQRAAIADEWLVASMPWRKRQTFVLANLEKRIYWDVNRDKNIPSNASIKRAIHYFCQSYAADDPSVKKFCLRQHQEVMNEGGKMSHLFSDMQGKRKFALDKVLPY